jgi:lysophospholipase L1-like esterase
MKRRSFLSGCVRAVVAAGFWIAGRQLVSAQTNVATPTNAPPTPRPAGGQAPSQDWAGLRRYRQENAQLPPPAEDENRVVFMGDSITDAWGRRYHGFFPGKPYVNRGISGQTTPQMLIRFRPDVIALKPKVVVILAGTNDLAGNTGPMTPEEILGNLISMAELAKANGIRVVLASVLPANDYPWRPEHPNPSDRIIALNAMLKDYATKNGLVYLDYFSALVDDRNGLKKEYAQDAVHPNQAGYDVMGPLAEKAIQEALRGR